MPPIAHTIPEISALAVFAAIADPPSATDIGRSLDSVAGSLKNLVPSEIQPMIETLENLASLFAVIGLPILAVEVVWLWRRGALSRARVAGMATSFFCAIPLSVVEILLGLGLVTLYFTVGSLSLFTIPVTWWSVGLCLLLTDIIYYGEHRLEHRINALWSLYHVVHHSADHFDQSVAYRISFVDFFFSPLFFLPLVVAGFDPVLVLICLTVVVAYQTWLHTELIGKLPWLDPWLNTPSNHRVHHGTQVAYLDKNYGGILIIWDRLFGSFQAETERPNYGITDPLRTANPLAVHGREAWRLARSLGQTVSLRRALRTAFGPPGA